MRMKKLSEVFTTCENSFSDTEPGPHHPSVTDGENETFQPLVRTTRIVSGKSPLDDVVEKMIQTPELKSSTVSSVMNCPLNPMFPSLINLLHDHDMFSDLHSKRLDFLLSMTCNNATIMFIPGKLSINVQSCGGGSHS